MTMLVLSPLSDQAKLWPYPFERALQQAEAALVLDTVEAFRRRWRSHGAPVISASDMIDNQIVLLAGEVRDDEISGCGIDASVRVFKGLRDEHGLDGLKQQLVYYRDLQGRITAVSRPRFQLLVQDGVILPETIVFDLTIETVGDVRAGRLERPFSESWHAQAFALRR